MNTNNNIRSRKKPIENVLVLQGGGSLGAFACGVFKALYIKFDIVARTSIGAINGSKNDNPAKDLEDFWIELAESSYSIIPYLVTLDYDDKSKSIGLKTIPFASLNAAIFGVPKMFIPRWFQTCHNKNEQSFFEEQQQLPWKWTYVYDNSPLGNTLEKYIDFKKLSPSEINEEKSSVNSLSKMTLIVTAVDVLTAEPLIFDSLKMPIQLKHLLASIGYSIMVFLGSK